MSQKEDTGNMTLATITVDGEKTDKNIPPEEFIASSSQLENDILDNLAGSAAIFKSQQKDDPELSHDEKKTIALELLHKSRGTFLGKFGKYLKKEHLSYFKNDEDYEVTYHLSQLERYFNDSKRQTDVKNRRYQALKILVEKGEYFSEKEMMKRNPLLYENLIGQYLTEEQKKKRDNIDTTNITFVNLLLESIERDRVRNLIKSQQDKEDEVEEENDSESDSEEEDDKRKSNVARIKSYWGEMSENEKSSKTGGKSEKLKPQILHSIPIKERQILREEFVTQMYESFLEGKDTEFDYSTVDDNETYDNIDMRNHDEEEKYFDSESPETVLLENIKESNNDSEDELDVYMRSLKVK